MRTLGRTVANWLEGLPSPADRSKPFILSDDQALFVMLFYAVDDGGNFIYRRALLEQAKGWGKSPFAAALAIAEFCGPTFPSGFDAEGQPVGRPWGTGDAPPPWIQVASNAQEQADANVYSMIWSLMSENGAHAAEALHVDLGRTRLYRKDVPAAKLEAVTSKAGSREGQRLTFGLIDESHLMTKESGGIRLAKTIRRNAGKMGGRVLELANAPELGIGSVAEQTADAYAAGEPGILLVANRPSVEPTEDMADDVLLSLLGEVYNGIGWMDLGRILAEVRDPDTGWSEAVRYFFNMPSAGTDALVDPGRWAELLTTADIPDGSRIGLGFVGPSPTTAALIGCTTDGTLFTIGGWGDPVPRRDVQDAVAEAFATYDVGRMFVDVRNWRSEAETWLETFGEVVVAFPTTSPARMAPLIDRFAVAVATGGMHHVEDPELDMHFTNARLRAARSGRVLEVADPDTPIVGVVASLLAFEAAATMPEPEPMAPPSFRWL
jgi:hypothetical protein